MIQIFKHTVYEESIANVENVLRSGWTGLGHVVTEFEDAIKQYLDTPYAVAVSSGTAALQLALQFIPSDRFGSYIITTPNTFISTNHSILHAGFQPVFADIDDTTGSISIPSVLRLLEDPFIRPRVRGIMVVHYGGQPVDMDQFYDIANSYNIDIIEDAAHAFGAVYKGARIGCKYSKLVCFSFHATKPLGLGDGGLLTTNSKEIDIAARKWRWCGINKTTQDRFDDQGYKWDYNVEQIGFKAHMNNIQAAIGLGQLIHTDTDAAHRQALVDIYRAQLSDVPNLELLHVNPDTISANHLFVIKCQNESVKNKLMAYLATQNIQTGCHYRPSNSYKIYSVYESDHGCPQAMSFFERAVTLPLHAALTKEDTLYVCEKIKEFFTRS